MPSATGRSSIILVVTVGRWLCVTLKQREHQCTIQKCFLYFLLFWVACRIRSASYFSRFFFFYILFLSCSYCPLLRTYVLISVDFGVCVCVSGCGGLSVCYAAASHQPPAIQRAQDHLYLGRCQLSLTGTTIYSFNYKATFACKSSNELSPAKP